MLRIHLWIAAAVLAVAAAAPADASECIAGCKVPLRSCLESLQTQKDACREACAETPPGPERGTCMRDCALSGVSGFGICREDMHACRDLCVSVPIECRSSCVDTATACRTDSRAEAAACRSTCQDEAAAMLEQCQAEGGDRETCSDAAGEFRSACLDDCGFAQSLALEGCGSDFEACVVACTPPDEGEEDEEGEDGEVEDE